MNIEQMIKYTEEQSGVHLMVCPVFTKIKKRRGRKEVSFNVSGKISETNDFSKLQEMCRTSKVFESVEPNGINRVSFKIR